MTTRQTNRTAISRVAERVVICSTLAIGAAMLPQAAYAASDEETFYNSGYNYCDATLLAAYWGLDSYAAKVTAGQKIKRKNKQGVKEALANGRTMASCEFSATGHTYEDAEKLASYWGMANVVEAKNKVALLYTRGNSKQVKNALKKA